MFSVYVDYWWGEGEAKFFLDENASHPTIRGTGVEDYMGSAWRLSEVADLAALAEGQAS